MESDKTKENENSLNPTSESFLDQAETLIWALLDDEIEPTDVKRLEKLIRHSEAVRQRYINCVQMHTDLHGHFGGAKPSLTTDAPPESPVLGSLGDLRPESDTWPPVTE